MSARRTIPTRITTVINGPVLPSIEPPAEPQDDGLATAERMLVADSRIRNRPRFNPPANTGSPGPSNRIAFWWRTADQLLLGFLLIALLLLLIAFRWKLSGIGRGEIEIVSQQPREYFYTIDINQASWVEWAQLDGIGEKLARRIVKDREDNGPFISIDSVRRVRGLGPKLIEKIRPFLKAVQEKGTVERSD